MGIRKGGENGRRYFKKDRRGNTYHIERDIADSVDFVQIRIDDAQIIPCIVLVRSADISGCAGRTSKRLGKSE